MRTERSPWVGGHDRRACDAIWGFAWLGSHCGAPARAIEIRFANPAKSRCAPTAGLRAGWRSFDADRRHRRRPGRAGPTATARLSNLRLAGQIDPGTTSGQLAPIDLTLRTTGSAPITLDPCPAYAGRDYATARSGGFSDPISPDYLPCTNHQTVIGPGHPLHWTIPATNLLQTPGTGVIPGSTVYVQLGIAGVPPLRLTTAAHRQAAAACANSRSWPNCPGSALWPPSPRPPATEPRRSASSWPPCSGRPECRCWRRTGAGSG